MYGCIYVGVCTNNSIDDYDDSCREFDSGDCKNEQSVDAQKAIGTSLITLVSTKIIK